MANSVMYCSSIIFLKLSLGNFFLRFLMSPWQRRTVYVSLSVSTTVNIFYGFWTVFNCGIPHNHQPALVSHCPSNEIAIGMSFLQAACNAATDIILTIMPIPLLWDSMMKLRDKICVGFILVLATTYVVLNCFRLYSLYLV
jgi:hypothetical protein